MIRNDINRTIHNMLSEIRFEGYVVDSNKPKAYGPKSNGIYG